MNFRKLSAIAVSAAVISTPSQAAIVGYFDVIQVGMVDYAHGWICDTFSPNTAPAGNLVITIGGPYGQGQTYYEGAVSGMWGGYRPDVGSSGYCGTPPNGNNYAGWSTGAMYLASHPTVHVYYRHPGGSLQELGGSGKDCTGQYPTCY